MRRILLWITGLMAVVMTSASNSEETRAVALAATLRRQLMDKNYDYLSSEDDAPTALSTPVALSASPPFAIPAPVALPSPFVIPAPVVPPEIPATSVSFEDSGESAESSLSGEYPTTTTASTKLPAQLGYPILRASRFHLHPLHKGRSASPIHLSTAPTRLFSTLYPEYRWPMPRRSSQSTSSTGSNIEDIALRYLAKYPQLSKLPAAINEFYVSRGIPRRSSPTSEPGVSPQDLLYYINDNHLVPFDADTVEYAQTSTSSKKPELIKVFKMIDTRRGGGARRVVQVEAEDGVALAALDGGVPPPFLPPRRRPDGHRRHKSRRVRRKRRHRTSKKSFTRGWKREDAPVTVDASVVKAALENTSVDWLKF